MEAPTNRQLTVNLLSEIFKFQEGQVKFSRYASKDIKICDLNFVKMSAVSDCLKYL